jgi:hypothetical protein
MRAPLDGVLVVVKARVVAVGAMRRRVGLFICLFAEGGGMRLVVLCSGGLGRRKRTQLTARNSPLRPWAQQQQRRRPLLEIRQGCSHLHHLTRHVSLDWRIGAQTGTPFFSEVVF